MISAYPHSQTADADADADVACTANADADANADFQKMQIIRGCGYPIHL